MVNNRRSALSSLSTMLGDAIYLNPSFFDDLEVSEDVEIGGSLFLVMTMNATMTREAVNSSSYGNVDVGIFVNQFETKALFNTKSPLNLDVPLELPSGIEPFIFELINGTFGIEFVANISSPLNLLDLFSGAQNTTSLDIESSLDVNLPLSVGTAGVHIGVDIDITDQDLFADPSPAVEYRLDVCEVVHASKTLFEELRVQIMDVIESPLKSLDIGLDIDKITQPLVDRVNETLGEFESSIKDAFDSIGCSRRSLQATSAGDSLKSVIEDAIDLANSALETLNISISADVTPYFDKETLAVGVFVGMAAKIQLSPSGVIGIVTDFLNNATQPEIEDDDFSKMGLGSADNSSVKLDLGELLDDTVITAEFDVDFAMELNLVEIQHVIKKGSSIDAALRSGISLRIEHWGATASILVDPFNAHNITLLGRTQNIMDSYISITAELRSKAEFFYSVQEMIDDAVDTSVLVPSLSLPLSAELSFNLTVYEDVSVNPVMLLESKNLVEGDFIFDFDVGLDAFLNSSSTFGSNTTLDSLFEDMTGLLDEVISYAPSLTAGNSSSALSGLFSIVEDFQDLAGGLSSFTDLVQEGETS